MAEKENIFARKLREMKNAKELAKRTPSSYQQAIYDYVSKNNGNALIQACAGSGKTTTSIESLKLLPKKSNSIFVAFNARIVEELKDRVPKNTLCSTIHGLGWQSILKHYRSPELVFDKTKNTAFKLLPKNTKYSYIMTIVKIIELMRMSMLLDEDGILEIMDKHGILLPPERNFLADTMKIFLACIDNQKEFDYTDMVFFPAINTDMPIVQRDFIFVDECQDLNTAQHMVIDRMKKNGTRTFYYGDEHQAIYGFSGSDIESFDSIRHQPNTKLMPLSVCYRCSKAVIEKARLIVPEIEYSPFAEEGNVQGDSWENVKDGDWVICRNVRPLVIMCMKLIIQGKRASIRGNDIGKTIINTLKNTKQNNKKMCYYILERQIEKQEEFVADLGAKEPEKAPSVVEMRETLLMIKYIGAKCRDVDEIIAKLTGLFTDKETEGIQMMTIHKSKGLEAKRVFLLCPELIPSRYAIKDWQKVQENNLLYVGFTRAKTELILVNDFKIETFYKDDEG